MLQFVLGVSIGVGVDQCIGANAHFGSKGEILAASNVFRFAPESDIAHCGRHVCFVPETEVVTFIRLPRLRERPYSPLV
jgi:hypothetical protein